jgi:bacteriorhodopsin
MSRQDWQILGLVMFASPLVVTGLGAAISHGYTTVAVGVVAVVLTLLGFLNRHHFRRLAADSHDRDEHERRSVPALPGDRRS